VNDIENTKEGNWGEKRKNYWAILNCLYAKFNVGAQYLFIYEVVNGKNMNSYRLYRLFLYKIYI